MNFTKKIVSEAEGNLVGLANTNSTPGRVCRNYVIGKLTVRSGAWLLARFTCNVNVSISNLII